LLLAQGDTGLLGAGNGPHPEPLAPPDGFEPIQNSENLHYSWSATSGGERLLGTEPVAVRIWNGGYDLAEVALRIRGLEQSGLEIFRAERAVTSWPRGSEVKLEIASWEIPDPVHALHVELLRAQFAL
jgi:hypothetical protein